MMIYNISQFYSKMDEVQPYNHNNNEHYLVRVDKQLKCICQMCSCGKHKCPREYVKGDFQTSYASQYKDYKVVTVPQQEKYRYSERHYNPEVLRTNYQETYLPLELDEKTMSVSRLGSIGREILKSEPFVGATAYKQEYKPFKIQVEQPSPSKSQLKLADSRERASLKFEGSSSYKSAFQELPIPKLERYKHPEAKNSAPFQGTSSYKNDFAGFKVQLNADRPSVPRGHNQVKFQGTSSYNNDYGSFKVVTKQSPGVGCKVDQLKIPSTNYINNSKHIYYDERKGQFI